MVCQAELNGAATETRSRFEHQPQRQRTIENGTTRNKMRHSSIDRLLHHSGGQRVRNQYSQFPCTFPIPSGSESGRLPVFLENGDIGSFSAAASASPLQHTTHVRQQQQQRLQRGCAPLSPCNLPPRSPSSIDGRQQRGVRGEGTESETSSGSRTSQHFLPLPRLVLPPSQRSLSCGAEDSLFRGDSGSVSPTSNTLLRASSPSSSTMPSLSPGTGGGSGGCHSSPCSPTFSQPRPSDTYLYLYKHLPKVSSETDFERLGRSMHGLCEGCFYYPDMDSDSARTLLQNAPEGTFIVRASSDPKFLFALTVKTARGATSVRILYQRGFFQLDCEEQMKRKLPRFETMLELLDFHMTMCREHQGSQYRWLESSRKKDMVVRLTTPRRHSPPSLSHLARVTVNRCLEDLHLPSRSTDLLPLPDSMKSYLRAYPYKV